MKTVKVLICGVIMGLLTFQHASAQLPVREGASAFDRSAVVLSLIETILKKGIQEEDPAAQIGEHWKASEEALRLCPTNLVVKQVLKRAIQKATKAKDDPEALKLLREGLIEAQATLAFKPLIEASLPEGFPEITPVGEIQVKQYPAYRLARTPAAGAGSGAFWTLFTHIKKKDIAMTAPVEMTYRANGKNMLQVDSMAFLYRSTKQGKAGIDEKVQVIDVSATTVLSLGMRGDVTESRLAEAKAHLDTWLIEHSKEYEANGPLRVMGYNSPFVAANRRFTEVELPVRRKSPPKY